jgi:SAM-dependent methyltransferase
VEDQPQWAEPQLACDLPIERNDAFVHNELVLSGWALSPAGVAGVFVQIDDRLLHASYGLETPWLAESLPGIAGSDRAGYRLQIDTSAWTPGRRQVTVTAYDQDGGRGDVVGAVDVVPFDPPKYTKDDNRAAIAAGEIAMWVERPAADASSEIEQPVEIAGWAYAAEGVESVLVTIDGHARHEALRPIFRPDLVDDYGEQVARQAGFLLRLHPRDCAPGWHRLSVVATGGGRRAVGLERDFACLPEPPPVEAPAAGEAMPIHWRPGPRPSPPRPLDHRDPAADGAIHETERRLRAQLTAQIAAGRDVLDVSGDDVLALPYDDASFDVVACFGAVDGAADPAAALEELRRVLRADGVLLIGAARRAPSGGARNGRGTGIPGGLERALRDRFANVRVVRQQTLLASIAADDETLAVGDGESKLELDVRKLGEGRPGGEDHTLAVAGDGELPELPATAMLAPAGAIRRLHGTIAMWEDRALLAEADAAASRNHANIAQMHQEATLREWRDSQQQVTALEQSLGAARAELAEARARLDERTTQLEARAAEIRAAEQRAGRAEASAAARERSLSWRITRPLRAAKRGALRARQALRRR